MRFSNILFNIFKSWFNITQLLVGSDDFYEFKTELISNISTCSLLLINCLFSTTVSYC